MAFQKNKYILIFLISLLFTSCFDQPGEFVSPVWDTQVHFPITTDEFTLMELVEDDSSNLVSYKDPNNLGLIYYADTQNVSTINIDDELKLNPFETSFSQSIGTVKVAVPIPNATIIKVEEWAPDVTSGSTQVFPEQEGNVIIDIAGVETVESILIESGDLNITIANTLPVEIVLKGLKIQNAIDQSVIAERTGNVPSQWVTLQPFQVDTLSFPIENKIVTNALQYVGTIWSIGSNGQPVTIRQEAGTAILALFENLIIAGATAQLPEQNFNFSGEITVDDSTSIEEVVFESGSATITINNNLDVSLTADVIFENLYTDSDQKFSLSIPLNRNEQNKVINIPSLNNWKIATTTPGTPTSQLSYTVNVVTDSSDIVSTIFKDDSISFNIKFNESIFKSFEGKLKPTTFNLDETGIKLDYGDLKEQINFGTLNFENAFFNLYLNSSANVEILVEGDLFASNGVMNNTMALSNINIPSQDPVEIEISNLVNGFTQSLPDSFSLQGHGILNPQYVLGRVSRGDSVFGEIDFEIPLNVGISNGIYNDTLNIDLGDVNKNDIDKLNYGEVTFTIESTIPVGIKFTSEVLDSNYNYVIDLPTDYNNIDFIEIPKPEVSENGDILNASVKTQTISLYGEDVQKVLDSPYLLINVEFSTSGENGNPVKFKTSNKIKFDVRAKAEYRVE